MPRKKLKKSTTRNAKELKKSIVELFNTKVTKMI